MLAPVALLLLTFPETLTFLVTSTGNGTTANPVTDGNISTHEKYDYAEVLKKSILFFESERSGKLPASNRIHWRGDSALHDGSDVHHDLTGGWYDAGAQMKYGLPMASTTTLLLWGLIQWKDAYMAAGQLDYMYDCVKWPLDYFIKCHTAHNELYVQVGDSVPDHLYGGRPEDMTMARPAYKVNASNPGSEVVGETAAALAAGYIAFKDKDPGYASTLLSHAKQLYDFATKYQGNYNNYIPQIMSWYPSTGYQDELVWAGVWLYKATGEQRYLNESKENYKEGLQGPRWALSWDSKQAGVQILLYEATKEDEDRREIIAYLHNWMPGGKVEYTPKGLAWIDKWGPIRYAANSALVALMAAENGLNVDKYRAWAEKEINYILGDTGRSYVIGFGENYPLRPHHRSSACQLRPAPCGWADWDKPTPSPQIIVGAVVAGPDEHDVFLDVRGHYYSTQVSCDYNSGFQSSVAGLKHLALAGRLPTSYRK